MSDIRKGIADILYRKDFDRPECFPNRETGLSKYERTILYKESIDQIISYLKSRNAVRLTGQEFPTNPYPKGQDLPNQVICHEVYQEAQRDMIKANFKTVEDLE